MKKPEFKKCQNCGEWFVDKRNSKRVKFCSKQCKYKNELERANELRKIAIEMGRCSMCRKNNVTGSKFKLCVQCRIRHKEYQRKYAMQKSKVYV